jgi:hypothetical protein
MRGEAVRMLLLSLRHFCIEPISTGFNFRK